MCRCQPPCFNIFFGHVCRPRSTHTAPIPVPAGSVHVHTQNKPSRTGAVVSRSQLVELVGAATCVGTWLGHGLNTEPTTNRKISYVTFFLFLLFYLYKPSSTISRRQTVPAHSNIRAMPSRYASGGIVRPTLLLMRRRRSRERPAVAVVHQ